MLRSHTAAAWLRVGLLFLPILLNACAPRATATSVPPAITPSPLATATHPATTVPLPVASATLAATAAPTATELPPVPTSRGDQLEATDPGTVTLASGGLQLVEFFAFW